MHRLGNKNLKILMDNLKKDFLIVYKKIKSGGGQKGVSLYLAIIILIILLAMALGLSTIVLSQIKIVKGLENSVVAIFAADTGVEEALYRGTSVSGSLENGASYDTLLILPGEDCDGDFYCIQSTGIYKETRRAIEIQR